MIVKVPILRSFKLPTLEMCFAILFAAGFLLKYNHAMLHIFGVPTVWGLLLKNATLLVAILFCLVPLVEKRLGRAALLTALSLFTLLFFANLYYHRYFGNYLSYTDIIMGQGGWSFTVLVRQLVAVRDLLYLVDIALLIYLYLKCRRRTAEASWLTLLRRHRRSAISGCAIALLILGLQGFITNAAFGGYPPGRLYARSSGSFVGVYGMAPLYLYEFFAHHFSGSSQPARATYRTEEGLNIGGGDGSSSGGVASVDRKPNIIAIQVESLDERVIDFEYQGHEVTPFLNNLKEESIYANRIYAQHVNGSFDAELSMLTSLYPVNKSYTFSTTDMSAFDSLARILNTNGYHTLAFHANDAAFFNRDKAFSELGFDRFYSRSDYSSESIVMDVEDPFFGINDFDFFLQSLRYLETAEEPFFAFMITVTSHTPFDYYPPEEAREPFEEIGPALVRDYLNSMSFVDKSLEMFFAGLEERGLSDNTVLLIYSDHAALVQGEAYASGGDFQTDLDIKHPEHIPLFIYWDDAEPRTIETAGSTTDIAPTILDLIGAEEAPPNFMGSSLLEEEDRPVIFLHELPQVLYRDQLFVLEPGSPEEPGELVRIGGRENPQEATVELSSRQEERAVETIMTAREMMSVR